MFDYRRDPESPPVHVLPFAATGHNQNRECRQSTITDTSGDQLFFFQVLQFFFIPDFVFEMWV